MKRGTISQRVSMQRLESIVIERQRAEKWKTLNGLGMDRLQVVIGQVEDVQVEQVLVLC